jgi:hypothetical protein
MVEINISLMCADAQIKIEQVAADVEKQFYNGLKNLVVATFNEGKRLAPERTKSFTKDWLKGYNMYTLSDNSYLIQLKNDPQEKHGLKPCMIEEGFPKFDMKPGFLNGPRAKTKNGKKYNIIPFEHSMSAVPTNIASSIRQEGFKAIVREKKLGKILRDSHGVALEGRVASIRTGAKYGQLSEKTRRIMGSQDKNLDGLTKYQKTYEKKTEGTFLTFRRVTSNSPKKSWWHH